MVLTTRRQAKLQEAEAEAEESREVTQVDPSSSASSSSSSSSSSTYSDDSDDDSSSDEEEEEGVTDSEYSSSGEQDLDELFQASLKACQAKEDANLANTNTSLFETNADEVRLGEIEIAKKAYDAREAVVDTKEKGKERLEEHEVYFERLKRGDDLGANRPKSEAKQKRDRKRESEKTAGSKWFDMPAFPRSSSQQQNGTSLNARRKGKENKYPSNNGPTAEEMTREIQAIRLRNAMDPKRFYRGGNGAGGKAMPAFAQMGRIISSNAEPASTLTRSERGRNVIDELVKDTQTAVYTKRKFGEQQARTDVGRSSHISKRKGNNSGKRQRR